MTFPLRTAAILAIRRRADMVNSPFVTDDEIVDLLNDNLEFIWRECVSAYGESVFCKETTINVTQFGASSGPWPATGGPGATVTVTRYSLPTDFQRLIRAEWSEGTLGISGPDYTVSGQRQPVWYAMRPIDVVRMPRITEARAWVGYQPGYWVSANMGPATLTELGNGTVPFYISFWPLPNAAVCVHIFYLPNCPRYGATDNASFCNLNQLAWQYVRDATAAMLLEKQRSDSSALQSSAARALAAVQGEQQTVDTNPRGTIDVYGYDGPRDELYEWR